MGLTGAIGVALYYYAPIPLWANIAISLFCLMVFTVIADDLTTDIKYGTGDNYITVSALDRFAENAHMSETHSTHVNQQMPNPALARDSLVLTLVLN